MQQPTPAIQFSLDDVWTPASQGVLSGKRPSSMKSVLSDERPTSMECNLPPGMWLLSIGPIDGNWANQDSVAVLWASSQASEYMFGLHDVNVVGYPIDPNPADIFHLPNGSRWRPFGGSGDCGTLFSMTTKAIAFTRRSVLLVCLDLAVFSGPVIDFSAVVDAFLQGRLLPQLRGTALGPEESVTQGEPTPAQRRYGFRLWMRNLNMAPEIRALVGDCGNMNGFDPSKISISSSWYLVSHIHILQVEDDDDDAPIFQPTESCIQTNFGSTSTVAGHSAEANSYQPGTRVIPVQVQENDMNRKSQPLLSGESRDESCRNSRGYFFIPNLSDMSMPLPSLGEDLAASSPAANAIDGTS